MKYLIVLILAIISIAFLNATPATNPVLSAALIDLTCTTNSNLNGLEIVDTQTLTARDVNGVAVNIDCNVLSIVVNNNVYLYHSTDEDMTGVALYREQVITFKNTATGLVSGHDFIITDMIIH